MAVAKALGELAGHAMQGAGVAFSFPVGGAEIAGGAVVGDHLPSDMHLDVVCDGQRRRVAVAQVPEFARLRLERELGVVGLGLAEAGHQGIVAGVSGCLLYWKEAISACGLPAGDSINFRSPPRCP